jgi:hypothetical protein
MRLKTGGRRRARGVTVKMRVVRMILVKLVTLLIELHMCAREVDRRQG